MREPKEILINGKTLEKILENHKHWLNKDVDEWKNMCANLNSADLSGADLSNVDLVSMPFIKGYLSNPDSVTEISDCAVSMPFIKGYLSNFKLCRW